MTLSKYLSAMIAASLICWALWVYVIFTIDPSVTNWIGFLLFYVSIFLAMSGTFAIVGFFISGQLHQPRPCDGRHTIVDRVGFRILPETIGLLYFSG